MEKPKQVKFNALYVEFDDPQFASGWSSQSELDLGDTLCICVGLKVMETEEYLELCMSQGKYLDPPNDDVRLNVLRIPKRCIHKVKELTFKRKRREMT